MKIVIFGLSITSSWGNGHATTYRALVKALHRRGHKIVFFEKNLEWYQSNRDLPEPDFCQLRLYEDWRSVLASVRRELENCDVAVVGSFCPDGIQAIDEVLDSKAPVKAFYDVDTPITVRKLRNRDAEYVKDQQLPGFDLYFSFTGGPLLRVLETEFRVLRAVPLYCSFDAEKYYPHKICRRYECDLSYMGTYAPDRQDKLQALFVEPAKASSDKKFLLAGPQYPKRLKWPSNMRHIKHLSPRWHPHFYSSSRLTLNLTRQAMVDSGFSPSVRLFEAAACGCPIISDSWPGLDMFFQLGEEVLVAENSEQVSSYLNGSDDSQLQRMAARARERVANEHSASRRAEEFEGYVSAAGSRLKALNCAQPLSCNSHHPSLSERAIQLIT